MSEPRMPAGMLLRQTYRIVGLIGRGGMGEVYEVTHERLAGRYVIKVLSLVATERPEALARFRREAQVTSSLQHPNIVQVVDFDTTDEGWPYLVMEYLDGPELTQLMREQGPLPLGRSLALIEQIAAGLSAAHRLEIVHRDLKPQNIFVLPVGAGGKEVVKIVDFGISKTQAPSHLTGESSFLGTPQYMAPEQAIGRSVEVDARADQFALGVIAYEMLTGQRPFNGDTVIALVYQIINVAPAPMGALVVGVPPAVDAVVRRALSKQPGDRFASVDEMVAALMTAGGAAAAAGPAKAPLSAASPPNPSSPVASHAPQPRALAFSTTLSGSAAQTSNLRRRRRAAGWVVGGVALSALTIALVQRRAVELRATKLHGDAQVSAGDRPIVPEIATAATATPTPAPAPPVLPERRTASETSSRTPKTTPKTRSETKTRGGAAVAHVVGASAASSDAEPAPPTQPLTNPQSRRAPREALVDDL